MKVTRQGVFETNSSSTHSICIAKGNALILPEVIHFGMGEFGREERTLRSVGTKASYLFTGLVCNNRMEDFEKIRSILESRGIQVSSEEITFETRQYKNSKGEMVSYQYQINDGYVDHANEMVDFLNAVCSDEDKLMQYLFSDLSFIRTGNDNNDSDISINVSYPYDRYYKGN